MRLKIFFASLMAAALLAANANAAIILDLVIDPATDADSGIPAVNGHVVTSTQTGALRYHLYAYDNTAGSFGISSYNIFVNGATTALHRTPLTTWTDADENGGSSGFPLLRSANNAVPIGTFQGSQPLPGSGVLVSNIGREVNNFTAKFPAGNTFAAETSGQWGNYATDSNLATGWVLIGEGAYAAGAPPTIGSAAVVTYFNEQFASLVGEVCFGAANCIGPVNTPPAINNFEDMTLLDASNPGSYSVQMTAVDPEVPPQTLAWTGVSLISYMPDFGGTLGVGTMPTISGTGLFDWNTVGSGRGHYVFGVDVSDGVDSDPDGGTVTLHIGFVPEPASFALFGIAMVGALGLVRRRNG